MNEEIQAAYVATIQAMNAVKGQLKQLKIVEDLLRTQSVLLPPELQKMKEVLRRKLATLSEAADLLKEAQGL